MAVYKTDANGNLVKVAGNGISVDMLNSKMLGVPSNNNWVNISVTDGPKNYYTAPANGYVCFYGSSRVNNAWVAVFSYNNTDANKKVINTGYHTLVDYYVSASIPVKMGDTVIIHFSGCTGVDCHFIPAEEV